MKRKPKEFLELLKFVHQPAIQKQTMENRSVQTDQESSLNNSILADAVWETASETSEIEHPPTKIDVNIEKEKINDVDNNEIISDKVGDANVPHSGDKFDPDEEFFNKNDGPNLSLHRSKRHRDDTNTSEGEPQSKRCRDENGICTYHQKNYIHAKGNTVCIEIGYVSTER